MKQSSIFKMFEAKGQQKNVIKSPLTGVSESIPAKDTAVIGTEHPSKPEQDQDGQNQSESAQAHVRNVSAPSNNTNAQSVKLGQRIRVYWPDDDVWYRGTVEDQKSGITTVLYDDGDTEKLNLCQEQFEILPGKSAASKTRIRKAPRQSVKPPVDSGLEDSDVEMSDVSDDGSDFSAKDESEGDDHAEEALDDEVDNADISGGESEDEVRVPRKRPAKRDTAAGKQGKQAKKLRPSENVDCSNGGGTALRSPAILASASAPDAFKTPLARGGTAGQTPGTGQLHSRLSFVTPGTAPTNGHSPLDAMNVGESAQRFTQRYKDDKFKFMCPSTIRDAKLRRPDHEAYDPSTCYIPPDWFKKYKISDGQRQWWDFKAKNWDSVLLFKMGKFYELFEMDAFTGVDVLGLQFMKGDQPHAVRLCDRLMFVD